MLVNTARTGMVQTLISFAIDFRSFDSPNLKTYDLAFLALEKVRIRHIRLSATGNKLYHLIAKKKGISDFPNKDQTNTDTRVLCLLIL